MDGRDDRRRARALTAGRRLDARRAYKPLDVGNGIVAGALTPGGRWLELGLAHPRHGRIVVMDASPFASGVRHDQAAVRAYRASLAAPDRAGFGIDALAGRTNPSLVDDSFPRAIHRRRDARLEVVTFAPPGRRGAVQLLRVVARVDVESAPSWTGTMRLGRAAYTQLTPGGRLPPAPEHPRLEREGSLLWIVDDELEAAVAVSLPASTPVTAGATATAVAAIALGLTADEAISEALALAAEGRSLEAATAAARRGLWAGARLEAPARVVERRAVAYALDCARCEVGEGTSAILADHVILPLVWTRDAYYVCRMLLATAPEGPNVSARFLRWCFDTAERPDGWWPRASLASGQAKDPVFQLDQQLYPLLLLDDHSRLTEEDALARRYASRRDAVISALLRRRSAFGLIATAETPADDPIDAPYHFSSHVLLWRVLRDVDPRTAEEVRAATIEHFSMGDVFAYAVRGPHGEGAVRYHDANDLPTVFAPGWGFCPADDPRWRATLMFGWSRENRAFVDGPYGGLGSVHTPHPWPLGDLQDIVAGRVLRDRARVARARARLRAVQTWDGLLPEAYDERTGAVVSRHWFAWPIALWALLEREPRLIAP